jgi:ATP-dependent helicase/DNAse subunit B
LLIVPTFADVETYRRELAASGAVFGVRVERFGFLLREVARRCDLPGRPLGPLARERVAALAVARTRLEALAGSASTPGFAGALLRLIDELEERRYDPPRVIDALRRWTEDDPGRRAYADELGAVYRAYRRELERAEAVDAPLQDAAALDALRLEPNRWGGTPVVVYGFDDLTPLQRDAIETLACHAGAPVTLTLTYEPGRTALAARARTFEELRALPGVEVRELEALAEHYAAPALHHLERSLLQADDGLRLFDAQSVAAGDALRLLEGGGARAEVELVAAEVARLLRDGWAADEIAVVWRSPDAVADLVDEVFAAYEVPVALTRVIAARDTALGRGLLALLRCALLDGSADDLLTWLRTPGVLDTPEMADRLELDVRTTGARTAASARGLWEERHWPLDAIDRVADAAARHPAALCDRLARETKRLLDRPHLRRAAVLDGGERIDASAAAALRSALRELGRLARRDADLVPAPLELERTLGELPVFAGDRPGPGRVEITRPDRIRARRVRALFLCGLNEQVFPRPATPDPLLSDDDRAAINAAAGLRLAHHEDRLAAERFLLYTAVSRPTELLVLSWRAADDEGEPAVRSLFVDDVCDVFADAPLERVRTRPLGASGWPAEDAPTEREAALAAAGAAPPERPVTLGPLSPEVVADVLPGDRGVSATGVEAWVSCPVKWFVERVLHPTELVPDPEALVRGEITHLVLRDVFAAYAGRGLGPGDLPAARERMHAALAEHTAEKAISVNQERLRGEVRRLEADLVRYLEHAAREDTAFVPEHFEAGFEVEIGALRLDGRIDRIDVTRTPPTQAVVIDYKGATAVPVKRWVQDGKLQLGLYLLAARELARAGELLAEPVGGLYEPVRADPPVGRGVMVAGVAGAPPTVKTDVLAEEDFEGVLADVLAATEEAVEQMRAGALEPRPKTCAWDKSGCSYPTICRCDA